MLKTVFVCSSLILLPVSAFADVKADCSTKMNGSTRCEFMNTGAKKESSCVVI